VLLEPDRRRRFHSLNPASEAAPADVTGQWRGKPLPAMNEVLSGTTTEYGCVPAKAPALMRVNSEVVSNEIDESDLQHENHDEQRIRT
jgi:hypothetical protein